MSKPTLETTRTDVVTALARGIAAACPFVGGLIAEAVNQIIPNQKLDRVVEYLRLLDDKIASLDHDLERVAGRLQDEHSLDLFEDGLAQAARALSHERRQHLANLLAKSLTQNELKYAESKKLLNLLRELTDPELLLLVYYSQPPTSGSQYHRELMEKYPEVLRPASRAIGIAQQEIDRGALQGSYLDTLARLSLLRQRDRNFDITTLGRLLLRYIRDEDNDNGTSLSG